MKAQEVIRSVLVDPDSAKFSGAYYVHRNHRNTICGQANSRNRMGGYVGATTYIVVFDNDGKVLDGGILPHSVPRDHRYFEAVRIYEQVKLTCLNEGYKREFFE